MSDLWPWQPAPTEKPKSSLDDRLREILEEFYYSEAKAPDDQIDQIKQAFADEGYVEENGLKKFYAINMMTGQELYKRYKAALLANPLLESVKDPGQMLIICQEAAKRAAGLE